jgi:hypothetical protein
LIQSQVTAHMSFASPSSGFQVGSTATRFPRFHATSQAGASVSAAATVPPPTRRRRWPRGRRQLAVEVM